MQYGDPNYLTSEKIQDKLLKSGISADHVDSILSNFWFHDLFQSFISNPDHFAVLEEYLTKNKSDSFSRFDFYEYFFYKIIPDFKKLRPFLRSIGLYFEQLQTNQITLEDFNDVLNAIEAPESLTAKYLEDVKLLSINEKDGTKFTTWMHHSITEFFAADHILSQKDPTSEAKALLLDTQTGKEMLKPSWTGTFRFLIEQSSEYFATWSIELLSSNTEALIDEVTETLIFSTPATITPKLKKALFDLVYNNFQKNKFWMPIWAYQHIYKFISKTEYELLKKQSENGDYIQKGNIAAIIDGMLQVAHPLVLEDYDFWKEKFVSFAKEENENGVLNRHALSSLENFKGQRDIIKRVEINASSGDSLVRDAFLSLCRAIDPNAPDSINQFITAIADDSSTIYGRQGLYEITSKEGIDYFLRNIIDNPKFIHEFLENESIFNKRSKRADDALLANIRKYNSPEIITLLKKLIIAAYTGERNYYAGKSYFLQQIALLIQDDDPDYLDELIKSITMLDSDKKQILFINDIENILSVLLKTEDIERLKKVFTTNLHPHAGYTFEEAIRLATYNGNPRGDKVIQKGIDLKIIIDPKTQPKQDDFQKKQEDKVYKYFQAYLSPLKEGTYFPQVFRTYIENRDVIEKRWSDKEKERLLWLAVDSNLTRIDPKNIKVRYKDAVTKSGEYTISSQSSYFTDVLQVIHMLQPQLLQTQQNRQKVINYIPFTYLSDFTLGDILGEITDEELESVNTVMLDKTSDIRYLVPQTYIYISRKYPNLKSPKKVLLSFATDPLISDSDREYALGNLEKYLSPDDKESEELLKKLWTPKSRTAISDLANGILISVYRNEKAISWRFDVLKNSATPFKRQEGFHSVGNLEAELDSKVFAKPLMKLNDPKYLKDFIALLDFSLSLVDKPDHRAYMNYLWDVVLGYIARDKQLLSIEALATIKLWVEEHSSSPEINWFHKKLTIISSGLNPVSGIAKNANALAFILRKPFSWTFERLRAELKKKGIEQDIDLFISHASAGQGASPGEKDFVIKLEKELMSNNLKAFLDQNNEAPTISGKVEDALVRSKFLIVIGSDRYCKRVNVDKSLIIRMEKENFLAVEGVTSLPQIFIITYKMDRNEWDLYAPASLKGGRPQIQADFASAGEVEKAVSAIIDWLKRIDPDTAKKIKKI